MAQIYKLHPENPQTRTIDAIVAELRRGAVMLYPTDTVYAIGCDMQSKRAVERVRQIKQFSNNKPLTFLCESLSNIAHYGHVSDSAYRIMKSLIPGPYTFVLPTTKLVPKIVMDPKRKTTGIRVPNHQVCLALLRQLGNPIISTSANLDADTDDMGDAIKMDKLKQKHKICALPQVELFDNFDKLVDLIIDDGSEPGDRVSTVLDLTSDEPVIIREGMGEIAFLTA
ncbi:Sua5/YciO/YrdC/YwlC family protein [Thalassoporum mexicanum PCC 7367]|uniref:L-threonylcarbamoyladenylate synthase n=1 Tax=Thalassoporum mexicanum TaxID=3457544 RepID=UPI00029FBF27|nr:L-threonylcarbamoyladenylate synthase [Pseudanabaena sp. PCC 7367]AFY70616.1 Sua5/YciO/YrdC/YwlC family protein [Pseudanabaena sp. PCC 7367]